jgi:hypothetical protein
MRSSFHLWRVWFVLILALVANAMVWDYAHLLRGRWTNVPPVPSERGALSLTLGDRQFAYRVIALMLQNFGDTGGRTTALAEYNYPQLKGWFFLEDRLDPLANAVPMLAAFFFGATTRPEQVAHVVDYLEVVGRRPEGEKWRWMAHAVYLARHVQQDKPRALALAHQLSENQNPHMPAWTRTMPALILNEQGSKEAAYEIMVRILKNSVESLDPAEVRYIRDYICQDILDSRRAADHPLCKQIAK